MQNTDNPGELLSQLLGGSPFETEARSSETVMSKAKYDIRKDINPQDEYEFEQLVATIFGEQDDIDEGWSLAIQPAFLNGVETTSITRHRWNDDDGEEIQVVAVLVKPEHEDAVRVTELYETRSQADSIRDPFAELSELFGTAEPTYDAEVCDDCDYIDECFPNGVPSDEEEL